jgi:hypothetical protein
MVVLVDQPPEIFVGSLGGRVRMGSVAASTSIAPPLRRSFNVARQN